MPLELCNGAMSSLIFPSQELPQAGVRAGAWQSALLSRRSYQVQSQQFQLQVWSKGVGISCAICIIPITSLLLGHEVDNEIVLQQGMAMIVKLQPALA